MLNHRKVLMNFKRNEIYKISSPTKNELKLEINNRRKTGKFTNTWKLNNTILTTSVSKKKSQGKLEST